MSTLAVSEPGMIMMLAFAGVAFTWVIAATVHAIKRDRVREETRREIAAYVAEGSMTPEQGERLLTAQSA